LHDETKFAGAVKRKKPVDGIPGEDGAAQKKAKAAAES